MHHTMSPMAKLTEAKAITNFTATVLADSGDPRKIKLAERMRMCATHVTIGSDGKIITGRHCKIRYCQVCEWRASRILMAQTAQMAKISGVGYPGHRWYYVVLTVKNPRLPNLWTAIIDFNDAFRRLYRSWATVGALKVFETPPSCLGDQQVGTVNLHANILALVPHDKANDFAANIGFLWGRANRGQGLAVTCEAITPNEVALRVGYSAKPTPSSYDPEFIIGLADQMHGVHRFQAYGVVKTLLAEVNGVWAAQNAGGDVVPPIDAEMKQFDPNSETYIETPGAVLSGGVTASACHINAINCTNLAESIGWPGSTMLQVVGRWNDGSNAKKPSKTLISSPLS